ncbi:MAG: hypothetical protein RL758_315 [Pseudomonadota bacterium]|jgi:hypothetical protein
MKIIENLESSLQSKRDVITGLEDMRPKFERLGRVTRIIEKFATVGYVFLDTKVIIRVDVKSIKEITPVLEVLTEEMGAEFDQTRDEADLGWREFTSSNMPWIRVDAELRGEGPECRRVIVGYEQKPVYEIKCGDDAAMPDAAPPEVPPAPAIPEDF